MSGLVERQNQPDPWSNMPHGLEEDEANTEPLSEDSRDDEEEKDEKTKEEASAPAEEVTALDFRGEDLTFAPFHPDPRDQRNARLWRTMIPRFIRQGCSVLNTIVLSTPL